MKFREGLRYESAEGVTQKRKVGVFRSRTRSERKNLDGLVWRFRQGDAKIVELRKEIHG